ncbi:MAG: hypothetical protein IFK91_02715 [Acidobacteria bacterium]|nr:hypothetical protein [Candidatus Sulfomarinibacter sp. MAG AM1]
MRRYVAILTAVLVVSIAVPAAAQGVYDPLFDRFNFKLEGSAVGLTSVIRLDSEGLGEGTELHFEDDLGLSGGEVIPSLSFEWQVGRRHRLGVRWQDIDRSSTAQALTEIHWGDEIIPIEANIGLAFDITTYAVDYTYYPWIKERWAGCFGIGFRVLDITTVLVVEEIELDEQVNVSAPIPYINFEYRRMLGEHWRMKAGLGWLDLTIGDISGSQYIGRLAFEYITDRRWGFGAAINLSTINVDWDALAGGEDQVDLSGHVNLDINDFSLYVRIRFGY